MKRFAIFLILFCTETKLLAQRTELDFVAATSILKTNQGEVTACPWFIYGPFSAQDAAQSTDGILFRDEQGHAIADTDVMPDTILKLLAKQQRKLEASSARVCIAPIEGVIDFYNLLNLARPTTKVFDVFYAATVIHAERPVEIHAVFGFDDWIRGFQNQRPLDMTRWFVSARAPASITPIKLTAGDNLIVLRIVNTSAAAGLSVVFRKSLQEAADLSLRNGLIFRGCCADTQTLPLVRLHTAVPNAKFSFALKRISGETVAYWADVANDEPMDFLRAQSRGVYRGEVIYEGATSEQAFFIGDPALIRDDLRARIDSCKLDEKMAINMDALFTRMDLLLAPNVKVNRSTDTEWQQKIAFTLTEIEAIINAVDKNKEPFSHVPGLHIRGFRSQIDDQIQHYRIYIPKKYNATTETGIPLIVVLPTTISALRPFIASPFVASHKAAVELAQVAEKYGVAVLWPGYRTQPLGNPCDIAHIEEAIEAIGSEYRIDQGKISLVGVCSGGRLAAMSVAARPDRYASVAFYDAVFRPRLGDMEDRTPLRRVSGALSWSRELNVVESPSRFQGTPVFVLFDNKREPGHGEMADSVEFIEQLRSVGQKPLFVRRHDGYDIPEPFDEMIGWAITKRRAPEPKVEMMCSAPNIAQALAEPFILVEGTGGTLEDREHLQKLSACFQSAWAKTYFGGRCRVIKDIDVTSQHQERYNMVLLGNDRTNSAWKAMSGELPLEIGKNGLRIGKRAWGGDSLGIQVVVPNPRYPKRATVLVGGVNLSKVRFGTMDLSIDGWYAASVWKASEDQVELIDAVRRLTEFDEASVTPSKSHTNERGL